MIIPFSCCFYLFFLPDKRFYSYVSNEPECSSPHPRRSGLVSESNDILRSASLVAIEAALASEGSPNSKESATLQGAFFKETEVSDYLGVPVRTLQSWRSQNVGPPVCKMNRLVRYPKAGLRKWLAETRRGGACKLPAGVSRDFELLVEKYTEALIDESIDGFPVVGPTDVINLDRELSSWGPDFVLALTGLPLDRYELVDGGASVEIKIFPHPEFKDSSLRPGEPVKIVYVFESGAWSSTIAAPWHPGLISLAAHIWRLRGGDGAPVKHPEFRLLACLGAAYLRAAAETNDRARCGLAGDRKG
ncbi:helix-turn-helix domain-containing protein [Methylocapsa polymorpha]|uniref:Helix-turn-helix domain-containing protein n=1 Tax=Methylocapsa polymorpha TaxID=3080828 RepID=A0ABZ0HVM9_9HYPH|nr:helix-turn-helix domain-containing protein [Methylocapsa sp. RX1]